MELVVDTNVISSSLIAGGKTRELIVTAPVRLVVPEFFHTELDAHRDEIQEKTGLGHQRLAILIDLLFEHIHVVPRDEFDDRLSDARTLIGDVDADDTPFLALALARGVGLWSDDQHF